jgi:hypothetical protein
MEKMPVAGDYIDARFIPHQSLHLRHSIYSYSIVVLFLNQVRHAALERYESQGWCVRWYYDPAYIHSFRRNQVQLRYDHAIYHDIRIDPFGP